MKETNVIKPILGLVAFLAVENAHSAFGPLFCPVTNHTYQCVYTDRVTRRPQMAGFMLPGTPGDGGTEQDFRDMAKLGVTLVQYQMHFRINVEDFKTPEEYEAKWMAILDERLAKLKQMLAWTEGTRIHFILNPNEPGKLYRKGDLPSEHMECLSSHRMFQEEAYEKIFYHQWEKIARFCKDLPRIYGLALIGEPNQTMPSHIDFWTIQKNAAERIRRIDPEVPIIVATNKHTIPYTYDDLAPIELPNIIYNVHMYLPFGYSHQGVLQGYVSCPYPNITRNWNLENQVRELRLPREFQLRHGARIVVGESSASVWAPGRSHWIYDTFGLYNQYGWDWCFHAFREWKGWSIEHTPKTFGRTDDLVADPKNVALEALRMRMNEVNARCKK